MSQESATKSAPHALRGIHFDKEALFMNLYPDFASIIYPANTKQRIILHFLVRELKERKGHFSKHSLNTFASKVKNGTLVWKNKPFRASRRLVYYVWKDLLRMGMISWSKRYVGDSLKEGFFVEFEDFRRNLGKISARWEKEFT
ncbi:hypothetical protein MUP59_05420 [Candidatus Bathyarchaeota archaeon]|jgi:hypothetical protein|nr:hypothetical protein [Candidatus Bathyarchaeota archaeon]